MTDEEPYNKPIQVKNVPKIRKIESDIRVLMDCLSTVGELRNPEDIGVEVRNMHLARFVFKMTN
jgi:hypothetical protein